MMLMRKRYWVSNKHRSYQVLHRELMPDAPDDISQYANNRIEEFHRVTRKRIRGQVVFFVSGMTFMLWRWLYPRP